MARRSRGGVLGACFEIAQMLPWWVGAILAGMSWAVLHWLASTDAPIDTSPARLAQTIAWRFGIPIAGLLQYVVPPLFLAGAVASLLGRRKRGELLRTVATNDSITALRGMSWRDFELLVGEAFRLRGYSVIETGGGGPDGGIDLELRKDRELFLAQCKQWRAFKVSVGVVRELFGVMAARGAAGGFVVTSGVFTKEAHAFASGRNIELLDGPALVAMIGRTPRDAPIEDRPLQDTRTAEPAPACPKCGEPMVRRLARNGANAGGTFWGCTRYPACRGVRSIG